MSAVAVLARAERARLRLTVENGALRCRPTPPTELLDELRHHKAELMDILVGDRCRHCGEPLDWRRAGPRAFADGLSAHHGCYEADAMRRAELARTPDALADEAEITLRGELP